MGALIVVGDGPEVLNICSGGFLLDAAFSPQRLSELAKMDGAIILASDASRIARANVHLVPNPNVPTSETGTRHRTAERVARSIDVPVISVSEDLGIIACYVGDQKHPLENIPRLLNRANQALQTLERYRSRLEEVSANLSALEVEDFVSLAGRRRRAAAHRDGHAHRRGDRRVRRRAGQRRAARPPAARRGARQHGRRAPAGRARLLPRWPVVAAVRRHGRPGRARHRGACRSQDGGRGAAPACRQHRPRLDGSSRGAIACCRGSPASPSRWSTTSSTSSAACPRSCGPPSTTSTTSRGWARPGRSAVKEGLSRLAESSLLDRFS